MLAVCTFIDAWDFIHINIELIGKKGKIVVSKSAKIIKTKQALFY